MRKMGEPARPENRDIAPSVTTASMAMEKVTRLHERFSVGFSSAVLQAMFQERQRNRPQPRGLNCSLRKRGKQINDKRIFTFDCMFHVKHPYSKTKQKRFT